MKKIRILQNCLKEYHEWVEAFRKPFVRVVILVVFFAAFFGCTKAKKAKLDCSSAVCKTTSEAAASGVIKRVVMVVLENTDVSQARIQIFQSFLRNMGGYLADSHAVSHPSLPNYLSLFAGTTFGIKDDFEVNLNANHLGNLLEAKGFDWKIYAEDYPGGCFLGMESGLYARRHVPPLNFIDVQTDPTKCSKIVSEKQWDVDVLNDALPAFSMYIPNNEHNGHDTSPAIADAWLSSRFKGVMLDQSFMKNTLFIITYDESGSDANANQIYTVFYGAGVKQNSETYRPINHYGILRTIEELFLLDNLNENDVNFESVSGIWE